MSVPFLPQGRPMGVVSESGGPLFTWEASPGVYVPVSEAFPLPVTGITGGGGTATDFVGMAKWGTD